MHIAVFRPDDALARPQLRKMEFGVQDAVGGFEYECRGNAVVYERPSGRIFRSEIRGNDAVRRFPCLEKDIEGNPSAWGKVIIAGTGNASPYVIAPVLSLRGVGDVTAAIFRYIHLEGPFPDVHKLVTLAGQEFAGRREESPHHLYLRLISGLSVRPRARPADIPQAFHRHNPVETDLRDLFPVQ